MQEFDIKLIKRFFQSLYRIRKTEEEIVRIYPTDKIKSPVHLSIGQEAIAVGVCEALHENDVVFGSYRGHAMYLAKGGDLNKMIAELYGKQTGCAKGKGGSMHLVDKKHGVMGTSAIVGTTIPISAGYALGLKYKKSNSIVASFFGDGAVDEGAFHESMNFAALKRLPVIFIFENNSYAIHSHHLSRHHSDNIRERARTYGMISERIENGDIFQIYKKVKEYSEKIRTGKAGPVFLECLTCRWKEHVGPGDDFHLGYRSKDEVDKWKDKDQLKILADLLEQNDRREIELKIDEEIKMAFKFAEESKFPDSNELCTDLFKEK